MIISAILGVIGGIIAPILMNMRDTTMNNVLFGAFLSSIAIAISINSIIWRVGHQAYINPRSNSKWKKGTWELALEADFHPSVVSVIGLVLSMDISMKNWMLVHDGWLFSYVAICGLAVAGWSIAFVSSLTACYISEKVNTKKIMHHYSNNASVKKMIGKGREAIWSIGMLQH